MSDVAGILTLMEHAADRLAQEETTIRNRYSQLAQAVSTRSEAAAVLQDCASVMVATTYMGVSTDPEREQDPGNAQNKQNGP